MTVSEINTDRERRLAARKRRDTRLRHMRQQLVGDTGLTSEQLRDFHAGLKAAMYARRSGRTA